MICAASRVAAVATFAVVFFSILVAAADDPAAAKPNAAQAKSEVTGRVVMDADGKPAANAEVRLVTWTDNGRRYDSKKTTTNERGEFVLEGVPPGSHRIVAFFEDFASRKSRYKGEKVQSPASKAVTLRLHQMPSISVRVLSKVEGKPIEGALVRLVWTDTERDHRTDKDGRVHLRALTREVWHVEVQAKGFAEQEQAVNLTETMAADIAFELDKGRAVFGTAKDEDGKPLAGVGISVFPADFRGGQIEYLKTDASGNYRFDYLPLNQGLMLLVSKEGYVDLRESVALTTASDNARELNLVLKKRPHGGTVRGTVRDTDGKSIAGATVSNHGRSSRQVRTATTDERGQFTLDDLYEGSLGHELVVKANGFAPQQLPFRPGTKEKPAGIEFTLEKGHTLRGRVVNEKDRPVAGASVRYDMGSGDAMEISGRTTTDADGHFEFDSLPAKPQFSISAPGYSEVGKAELPLDGTDRVKVILPPEGVIHGQVIDAVTRKPVTTFNVSITFSPDRTASDPGHHLSGARATSPDGERFTNENGEFLLKELVHKMPLQVTVAAKGYERGIYRRVDAESSANADVVVFPLLPIDTSTLIGIRGSIVDDRGNGIPGAELRLIVSHWRPADRNRFPFNWEMIQSGQIGKADEVLQFESTVSGSDGTFEFENVRPATEIEIAYWGEGISQSRLDGVRLMSEEERENAVIVNVTPGVVRGTIDRKAMPTVSGVSLFPRGRDVDSGYHRQQLSADQTTYEIRNIPPGSYQLLVEGEAVRRDNEGYSRKPLQRRDVEIKSGETLTIDVGAAE